METRSIPPRPDITIATTSPRVTPTPPRASRFGEILSNTVVRSAESAMRVLPGAPMMAVAVRGAGGPGALAVPMPPAPTTRGPEGPTTSTTRPIASGPVPGMGLGGVGAVTPTTGTEGAGIEATLQQSLDMNLYYLQIQEAVNAQNRSFTTLSNVLKAQHDTVKTAIGNIR
jgi:hypothetical protein